MLAAAPPHRAHESERWGSTRPPNDEQRWAVRGAGGATAAYLALWCVSDTRVRMDLIVAPTFRRQGLGARLIDFLIERARLARASTIQARPYADAADAFPLLASRDFRETMRMIGLVLDDVQTVALAPFAELEHRLTDDW